MPALAYAKPSEIGLDADRLQTAYELLSSWTDGTPAPVPSAAILVGRNGKIVEPRFFGRMGPEPDAPPIRRDSLFLLASITKPVVYLGAMLLVERGELRLSEPVTRYLPDFAAHHKEDTLVQHLFTHTSGLPDMLPNNVELRRQHAPLDRFIQGAIRDTVPLFPPGTNLSYQSMGTLTVAAIVQELSGLPIAEYLKRNVFEPLGLQSIALGSRGLDSERLVRVQVPDFLSGGTDYDWNSKYWRELGAPWGGLFSSPEDFAVICQTLLNGGRWQDVQLLSPRTVERMTTNRLNDQPRLPEEVRRTQPWGLGWRLNHPGTSDSWGDLLGPRVFGHTGASGTMVWIDPDARGFCILFTNAIRAAAPWRLVSLSNVVASAFV
jgi:CubicO group peptidase (beta-lactamase class C family)